jgi:cyclophilin family peptidyl-prolyl cis-trans isomerase
MPGYHLQLTGHRVAGLRCAWVFAASLGLAACALVDRTGGGEAQARPPTGQFTAAFDIDGATLVMEFDPAAAPVAVAALRESLEAGRWSGVAFDWVYPNVEIRTAAAAPTVFASEIDGRALGLEQVRIADRGAAMNLVQMELEPAFMRAGAAATPQLRDWIVRWRREFDPGFLVGVSRLEINSALGYGSQTGLRTRPVRRGSVALVSAAPGSSTLALAIFLRDQPARDGRTVVVGRVISGLDIAQRISIAARIHPKLREPVAPARIERAQIRTASRSARSSP